MPPEIQALIQEGQEAQGKLQELSAKLSTIQEQALSVELVVTLRDSLEKAAEEAIIEGAPEMESTLERLPILVALLEKNPEIAAGNPEAFSEATTKLIEEYETLTAKLQPLQAKAAALPEIEAARKELFDTLHAESLKIDTRGRITDIGAKVSRLDEIEAQYMGLMRFRGAGVAAIEAARASLDAVTRPWMSVRPVRQAYMTDLLMEMILIGVDVHAVAVAGGWLEIDTVRDFEMASAMIADGSIIDGSISRFFDPTTTPQRK